MQVVIKSARIIKFGFLLIWASLSIVVLYSYFVEKVPTPKKIRTPTQSIRPSQVAPTVATTQSYELLSNTAAAHSSSLTSLSDGRVMAAWFAGSREGARDVIIAAAIFDGKAWQALPPIMQRQLLAKSEKEWVKKLGNPLIEQDPVRNVVHLFFVSVNFGGWAGSRLNHSFSSDAGKTWSTPRRLYISPFFNLSTLVRNAPQHTTAGTALPIYHELWHKYPAVLWLDEAGKVLYQSRISAGNQSLQPAIIKLPDNTWQAYMRNAGAEEVRPVLKAISIDAHTWSPLQPLDINNRDSALAIARLSNGELLMAFNDQLVKGASGREILVLATSPNGEKWQRRLIAEAQAGGEFSYPALLVKQGVIDLTYTYQRKYIKHQRINEAWLLQQKIIDK